MRDPLLHDRKRGWLGGLRVRVQVQKIGGQHPNENENCFLGHRCARYSRDHHVPHLEKQ